METNRIWHLLIVTLPTRNTAQRMRIWRGVKAMGCAVLRDGVYMLPHHSPHREILLKWRDSVRQEGGEAYLLAVTKSNDAEENRLILLFDRTELYLEIEKNISQVHAMWESFNTEALDKTFRELTQAYRQMVQIDYFPGILRPRLDQAYSELQRRVIARLSPGEPIPQTAVGISQQDRTQFQNKTWLTRSKPWIDRLASAWLIQRFIDPKAQFIFFSHPQEIDGHAIGYDFDGAMFSHVNEWVTFEVLLHSFSLEQNSGLQRLASWVHALDMGNDGSTDYAGILTLLKGVRRRFPVDKEYVAESMWLFDHLYAALNNTGDHHGNP